MASSSSPRTSWRRSSRGGTSASRARTPGWHASPKTTLARWSIRTPPCERWAARSWSSPMETVTTRIGQASAPLSSADGLVTANHLLAAEAGATILGQGGNAVDAAIATSFAVGVVEPSSSGVAGRGYLIIHLPSTGESVVFDGHERAPLAARPDMYRLVDPEAV